MFNYMKSEWYRISRGRELYRFTAIASALVLGMNIIVALFMKFTPNFPYGTKRYSFNLLTSGLGIIMIMGMILIGLLYAQERQNGTLKNAVAYGISREQIFIGKSLVALLSAACCMIVILVVYICSTWILLEGNGKPALFEMLKGVGAALPSGVAGLILAVVVFGICNKETTAILWWAAVIYVVPSILSILGMKLDFFARIARWMPWVFFHSEVSVTSKADTYVCIWNTQAGLFRCFAAGVIGVVIFTAVGIWSVKRKEIQ